MEVGNALAKIRDSELYRETHRTFEEYCRGKWGICDSRARQLVMAASVADNLATVTTVTLPVSERQVRPLTALEPEQQREAWKEAVEASPTGKPTAREGEMFDEPRQIYHTALHGHDFTRNGSNSAEVHCKAWVGQA
jgi:hypothetical protein